jgi:hypothetical protein
MTLVEKDRRKNFRPPTIPAQIRSPVPFPSRTYPPTVPSLIDGPRGSKSPPMAVLQPGLNRFEGYFPANRTFLQKSNGIGPEQEGIFTGPGFWTLEQTHSSGF